ncbi:hypothetical protein Aca07nite_87100 [Actinoplanes capillaceus]|uniref:Phosphoglycerate mutase n=1 Tax=Actinoplanes campanulatus TaxID=113559 RepID=A0ABQ3WZ76_9ACTN|nr:histidine phosphatase family protein [Actinoplanes capillaceus]GID51435.1 hypothetical protein Aca07nite_87100 [Actinoplanes capillaceus]
MPYTELSIARHGQAWCNLEQTIGGTATCRGLTPVGQQQATGLAVRLAAEHSSNPITAVYTSPIRRARETAAAIADLLRSPAVVTDDLREPDYGSADGAAWTDVIAAFGAAPALHPDTPIAEGAETWHEYQTRVHTALQRILEDHRGQRVVIIAHGETVTAAHHFFADVTLLPMAFVVDQTALTTWREQPVSWLRPSDGLRWALMHHNDTRHLAGNDDH